MFTTSFYLKMGKLCYPVNDTSDHQNSILSTTKNWMARFRILGFWMYSYRLTELLFQSMHYFLWSLGCVKNCIGWDCACECFWMHKCTALIFMVWCSDENLSNYTFTIGLHICSLSGAFKVYIASIASRGFAAGLVCAPVVTEWIHLAADAAWLAQHWRYLHCYF